MIIDNISESYKYEKIHPLFKRAFDFMKTPDLECLAKGRIILDGNKLFVDVSEFEGKPEENAPLEAHKKYIDIQVPIIGREKYGWKSVHNCEDVSESYSAKNDIMFFADDPDTYFYVETGNFVIFFPEDAHAPGMGDGTMKKLIIKVLVE